HYEKDCIKKHRCQNPAAAGEKYSERNLLRCQMQKSAQSRYCRGHCTIVLPQRSNCGQDVSVSEGPGFLQNQAGFPGFPYCSDKYSRRDNHYGEDWCLQIDLPLSRCAAAGHYKNLPEDLLTILQ